MLSYRMVNDPFDIFYDSFFLRSLDGSDTVDVMFEKSETMEDDTNITIEFWEDYDSVSPPVSLKTC